MLLDSLAGVVRTCAGTENERPITGLGQEQLTRGLFERPFLEGTGLRKAPRQLRHALLSHMKMRIDPFILFIEPRAPVTFFAPARRAGGGDLVCGVTPQVFIWRDQLEHFLVVAGLAHEKIQELRAFVPPMAEQLCVVRRHHDGRMA